MRRFIFAAMACASTLGFMSCANRSEESAAERRYSVDSAKAAAAVDSIKAYNDSITRARQSSSDSI